MRTEQQHSQIKEKLRRLPLTPGVYLMKDRLGTVLYVGKAKSLRNRVGSYFQPSRRQTVAQPKVLAMLDLICDFETIEVRSEAEALLLEGRLIKEYRPKYNTDFTDNKQFLLVRLDETEVLPRFRLTRNRREDGARYFGPYAHSGLLRQTLAEMRRRFGVLLGDAKPTDLGDGSWQFYDDARAEIFAAEEPVTPEAYRERLAAACEFLAGKTREMMEQLREEMKKAAEAREFERAALLRDRLEALQRTLAPARRFTGRGDPIRFLQDASETRQSALVALQEALQLRYPPATLECFDISHISGTHAVASMVRFKDGQPDRGQYRQFRIQTFIGNDDFRAMREVVGRRYRRLAQEERAFPDLVVIDGGAGQVSSALAAFAEHNLEPPPLIGLAKKEETIVFPDGREPLCLPREHDGLRLLQHLRDEAHRFANSFNRKLRSDKIKESILLDVPGLGKNRRQLLMERFGSLANLRSATAQDIAEIDGFGPILAQKVFDFLRQHDRQEALRPNLASAAPEPFSSTFSARKPAQAETRPGD